jgi:VWFA-related protein
VHRAVFFLALFAATAAAQEPTPAAAPQAEESVVQDADADADGEAGEDVEEMAPHLVRWLKEVEPLITGSERKLFLSLKKNYQRDAFVQQFWKVRDPYPTTPRNELKERWPYRVAEAKSRFGSLKDDRSRILLVHGPPAVAFEVLCTKTWAAAEVWLYDGTAQIDRRAILIFIRPNPKAEARIWDPAHGYLSLEQVLRRSRGCINGHQLQQVVGLINTDLESYQRDVAKLLLKPRPASLEWVHTFVAHSTDLPPGAEPIDAALDFGFPGRHQNRTVVQGLLAVPLDQVTVGEFAGYRSHELLLTGEVIRADSLFESFRYKFGFPEQKAPSGESTRGSVPLVFQRYLRPGTYRLVLKLEDLNSRGVYRVERELRVPTSDQVFEVPTFKDPRTEQLFAEATAAIAASETGIRLIPPRGELQTGFVRFDSLVSGDEIRRVRFYLDDALVLTKNRPPYSVEIDLGSFPDLHTLRVEALDAAGEEVAADEILINSGGYRFALKLVEPRRGKRYPRSLRARAEIEVPEGRVVEKVDFFLNETPVATLYQEPWVQPIVLPENEAVAYVRAVAYLPDGNTTEDLVFINAPDYLEELEIQFVELYTTVLDGKGRPVDGVEEREFTVFEDGVRQAIARFERVEDLPIHVGILIDNSASMVGTLDEVRKAALRFFQQAITPRDRAAVITFNNFPQLAVELTNDRARLGTGLAGLVAEGRTALYDSVMFALYYFTGIRGQRAILVLSDGKDESSRFSFDETLDYARRAGITVYAIGLGAEVARQRLTRLADETGGRSFFIHDIAELESIYGQIQRELRSQYLIAYQSSNTSQDETFRAVELKLDRPDVEVKTLSGYYP